MTSTERAERGRMVVVDDDSVTRDVVVLALREAGFEVDACESAADGLARVGRGGIDLVLLNGRMHKASTETCAAMKRTAGDGYLPVALMISRGDDQTRIGGLLSQADDVIGKPLERDDLLGKVKGLLEKRRLWEAKEDANRAFSHATRTCPLTGCASFPVLGELIPRVFARAEAHHEPLAFGVIDVDHLKQENAVKGRAAGDQVLIRAADAIKDSLRDTDFVARYGEDEFFVVLPGAQFSGVMKVSERIFADVSEALADLGPDPLTVSLGVALFPSRDVRTLAALLDATHVALAKAKREGGDHVCVFQQEGLLYTKAGRRGAA